MTKKFQEALTALEGMSPAMAKLGMLGAKFAQAMAEATGIAQITKFTRAVGKMGEVLKVAFSPLAGAVGAVGKLFSGLSNILMLPFGIMSKAFSGLSKAWDFITKPAEGANANAYEAARLNMSAVQLHELEYAEKASGTNGQFKSLLENVRGGLLDTDKWAGFASLGLNPQELVKGNAVDATQKVFKAIQSKFSSMGYNFNDPMAASFYEKAGLSDFMSFDNAKAMNEGFFNTTMSHFQNFMKTTQYNEKSFRTLNTRVVEVQRAFDNLHKQLAARLGPAASRVAGIFVRVMTKLSDAIFTDENLKMLEAGINKIAEKIEEFFNSEDAGAKIQKFVNIVCDALRQFARGLFTALDWIPGVNFSPEIIEAFDDALQNAQRQLEKDTRKLQYDMAYTRAVRGQSFDTKKAIAVGQKESEAAYNVYESQELGKQYKFIRDVKDDRIVFRIEGLSGADKGREVFKHEVLFDAKVNQ